MSDLRGGLAGLDPLEGFMGAGCCADRGSDFSMTP